MDGFGSLIEFSIALAGFTSIVVVFAHKDAKWNPFDKFRITNALMASIGSAFLASFPYGLSYLNFPEELIWWWEGLLVGIYILFMLVSTIVRRNKTLSDKDRKQLPQKVVGAIFIFTYAFLVILFLTLFGVFHLELKGLSYFGIILLLLISVFAFSRIIFYRPIDAK